MTEINNNYSNIIKNISANSNSKKTDIQPEKINYENNAKELSAEMGVLGKSQVSKPDNIQSDIDFCLKQSPEFLGKCDIFFEKAFSQLSQSNDDFAYEKACIFTKEFASEFV